MIKLSIKNRWAGSIIFEYEKENNTIAETVKEYIRTELSKGKFRADLTRADLTDADLTDADLTDADLTDADLTRANLTRANLTRANLTRANLTDADLTRANLKITKNDFWEILIKSQPEIEGLRQSLINGNVDGSTYEGDCCCLVGTVAKYRHCNYDKINGVVPDSSRPAERWFMGISKGHTPENSQVVKITLEWIDEFLIYCPQVKVA